MDKKLIVVLGPTASGKSELAVRLARRFGGEVVSADSRQVYRGMDIGSGKISREEMRGIPHYLLDVASPKRTFTAARYKKLATEAIKKIIKKNKIPILAGGTGFYIQSLIDGIEIPEVPPNWKLRKELEKKPAKELYKILKGLDKRRAKTIEKENPRRLVRAIEICLETKNPIPPLKLNPPSFSILIIGIRRENKELSQLIRKRLLKRLREGMIEEVEGLKKSGLSWQRLEGFGLEYRWVARYLEKKITYGEMIERLEKEIEHYAKRQMVWFKKDKRIHWVKGYKEAERLVKEFLKK